MNCSVHTLNLIHYRASKNCWKKHGINRHEMKVLSALYGLLCSMNRTVIGKVDFVKQISCNYKEKNRIHGGLKGLIEKGMLGTYEYVAQPESECVGLSELGYAAIVEYEQSVLKLNERFKPHALRLPGVGVVQNYYRRTG